MSSNSTECKQAEEELRIAIAAQKESLRRAQRSELRYKTLIEYAADALFVFNLDGRFVEVNQQACDSLGYTCEELLRMGIADVAPGHDLADRRAVWATLEPGKRYSVTATHRRKDGSTFPVDIHLAALLVDDEKLMMALVSDISERMQAEQRMQEQQGCLNMLIESAMDAVISTDENQNITIFNHAAEQMFGYRAADIIGQPLERLMPIQFRAKHRQQIEGYGRAGITTRTMNALGVVCGLRANGDERR